MRKYIRAVATAVLAVIVSGATLSVFAATSVCTPEQLAAITNDLAGVYELGADIDLGGTDWTPIGNDLAPFTGSFHGNGHVIRNLVCTNNPSANSYRGLFGKIAGGRVSSVAVEGVVDGSYGNESATDVGVGGFAGKIDSKSLVEGCSFDGEVANETTCNAGGFVGYTTDSPVILRCRAWGNVDNFSGKSDTGGFVGNHSGGSITDCCALMECSATDNGDASAGGFAGLVASARIANSWCSGCVDSRGGYVGAFVGKANTGPADLAEPLIDIGFDTEGNPSVKIPETVNADGATVTVLATEDLADWSDAKLVPMAYDASDGTWKPEIVERPPRLFFKWSISFDW